MADDHPALVAVVESLLSEHGYDVVGHARTGPDAVELARTLRPPLALVDLRMPGSSGLDLVRTLIAASPETRVVVYTAEADARLAVDVIAAGARGIVLKEAPLADLMRAVGAVCDGLKWVDPALSNAGARTRANAAGSAPTERELEVIGLIADGLPYEAIAARLAIGIETVRTHVRKASVRLDAGTRTELVATALRRGLMA